MLSRIHAQPGISRAELARVFGFSEMAATRIARDLLGAGLIEESTLTEPGEQKRRRLGRPKIGLRINPDGAYAAGITVSAYYSEVSICDANGKTIARREFVNGSFTDVAETARRYSGALLALIRDTGINWARIVGVGVALSAKTNPDETSSIRSEIFGWSDDGGRFWDEIRANTGLPVIVENIANALALSEMRFGVARDVSEFVLVHVATLAGVGVVSDHRIVRGSKGDAGRIGHFRSTRSQLRCTCGRDDCINLSATGFGILGKAGMLDSAAFDPAKLSGYARSLVDVVDDPANASLLKASGRQLASALDSVAKLLAPELIVISGILGAEESYFEGTLGEMTKNFGYGPESGFLLVKGQLSPLDAASLIALHAYCYSDQLDLDRLVESTEGDGADVVNA